MHQAWLLWPCAFSAPLLLLELWLPYADPAASLSSRRLRNLTLWLVAQAIPLGWLIVAAATLVPVDAPLQVLRRSGFPEPALLLLEILLLDALHYAMHLACHRIGWMWRFHSVHHADDELDATTGLLQHPGERALFALVQLPIVVALGISPAGVSVYGVALLGFGLMHHANIRIATALERAIVWLVVTPGFHRPHHHRRLPYTNSNYGFVLSVWDRMLGTRSVDHADRIPGFSPGLNSLGRLGTADLLLLPLQGLVQRRSRPQTQHGCAADLRAGESESAPTHAATIECSIMRGGTSKGLFFRRRDLPRSHADMLDTLRRALGAGSTRGVDGLGGLDPLANKIAVVDTSESPDADIDYWFAQVAELGQGILDEGISCGNILTAVGPFAVESGLVRASVPTTSLRIRCVNTGNVVRVSFQARDGSPVYDGDYRLAGVPGSGSPIELDYARPQAWQEAEIFPGGRRIDAIGSVRFTLIRCATTLIVARAGDFGLSGQEGAEHINSDASWLQRLERFRREAALRSGLGDVSARVAPKLALISQPPQGSDLLSHYFIPHTCHPAHAVTGALTLAVAARCSGTVTSLAPCPGSREPLRIRHPSGIMEVWAQVREHAGQVSIQRLSVLRTARRLLEGRVALPPAIAAPPGVSSPAPSSFRTPPG